MTLRQKDSQLHKNSNQQDQNSIIKSMKLKLSKYLH